MRRTVHTEATPPPPQVPAFSKNDRSVPSLPLRSLGPETSCQVSGPSYPGLHVLPQRFPGPRKGIRASNARRLPPSIVRTMLDPFHPDRLIETDGNLPPPQIRSASFRTPDRVRLRYAICPSQLPTTRGTVILLHGRNDAIEKYFETIGDLTRRGFMVATFDWRGQGQSARLHDDPTRGHVRSFRAYVRDLEAFLHAIVMPDCRGPFVILAHSMGALVALLAAPRLVNRIERIVAAAPLIALPPQRVGPNALYFGAAAMRLGGFGAMAVQKWPQGGRRFRFEDNPFTSDRRRFERNQVLAETAPQLFLRSPTLAWLVSALGAMRKMDDSNTIGALRIPTLLVTAGADTVVSSHATERLAWRMRSGHHLVIPGARHELLQEADRYREPFLSAFESFVGSVLPLDGSALEGVGSAEKGGSLLP